MGASDATAPLHASLADTVYQRVKEDIAEFRLVPGDRFTESEVASRLGVSRTPVRQALFRLQREGLVQVHFRSGWQVQPFDFEMFEHLYDLRVVLEVSPAADAEKNVQQPAVADVHLGRLHLTLPEVLIPRWQLPHHEDAGHEIEIPANRRFVHGESTAEFCSIPGLTVVVGEHAPKPPKGHGGDPHAKLR